MGAASLQAASLYDDLSPEQKRVWERLLHFRGGSSLIDEENFFVSSQGMHSPASELESFIELAKSNDKKFGRFKLPIACSYPARIQFLMEAKLLDKAPDPGTCIPWNKWKKEIAPEAVSIIFSTAYPNNPGSMFGHTFLRFHKKDQVNDLLDYGANFSALVDPSDWGPVYAIKGMFGGYPGFFDLSPYYIKVNEYNQTENRDLIEYELNLSAQEVHFMLAHLWELYNGAYFDYYFTWENCSFHLSELISLVRELPTPRRWFYLPADLIWAIDETPKLIRKIVQRPSLKKKTLKRIEYLDDKQWDRVKEVKEGAQLSTLGASVKEWDALIEWLNFENYEYKGLVSDQQKELLYLALKQRATLKKKSMQLPAANLKNRPELGHKAQRIGLGIKDIEAEQFLQLEYRSGFHDLLAKDLGFDAYSEFQFLKGSILYRFKEKDVVLEDFSLVEITSLAPWSKISRSLSWKVGAKIENQREQLNCIFCHRARTFAKLGLSMGDRQFIAAIFAGGAFDYSTHLKNNFEINANIEAFAGYAFEHAKVMLGFDAYFNVDDFSHDYYQQYFFRTNFFLSRNHELRLEASNFYHGDQFKRGTQSLLAQWGFYF